MYGAERVVRERFVIRRGKCNLCTLPSYCVHLRGLRNADLGDVQLLAQTTHGVFIVSVTIIISKLAGDGADFSASLNQ
jgi:hypothetical protein